jgi:hypothetical protein
MATRNRNRQFIVVRYDRSRVVVQHNIVYATCDADSADAYCQRRLALRQPHEWFEAMRRTTYDLNYGEKS